MQDVSKGGASLPNSKETSTYERVIDMARPTTRTRRTPEQIIDDLIDQGADLIKEAHSLSTQLTDTYRKVAGIIVDLRQRFMNTAGDAPDWKGTTQAYRDAAARMYEQAGIPADSVSGMQAAIRYHVGNVLRERLTEDELTAAGLSVESPLERARKAPKEAAEEGWYDDTVETLLSVAEDHPEVVLIDLRAVPEDDPLPLLNEALDLIQRAAEVGVTPANATAITAVLEQVIAEAEGLRQQASAPKGRPKRTLATAGGGGYRRRS